VIILDSLGVGALPDAERFGDVGSNTLGHICEAASGFSLSNLSLMGLGNLGTFQGIPPSKQPTASYGRLATVSAGKDTTTGHWELMGLITEEPFPTYPEGFPGEVITRFERAIGGKTLGNIPASGTEIIQQLGDAHLQTGYPIIYTSADSVFQIAAHESVVPVEKLYAFCKEARKILVPPHGVSRVIARPFVGVPGNFVRTAGRRDFALPPSDKTLLNLMMHAGYEVVGVGKIRDIFAGSGLTQSFPAANNQEGIDRTLEAMEKFKAGLIMTNLVDFDMCYGHRNDPLGYAKALMAFDSRVPELLEQLGPQDILVITADHGCDPTTKSTDHSREYVPLLMKGAPIRAGIDMGTRDSMADLARTLQDYFYVENSIAGQSLWQAIRCHP
jgi:phosphopentomutase